MLTGSNVEVLDDLLPPELKVSLCETVSWMPMYFINRWKRFKSHELDMHWHYPLAYDDAGHTADVEPQLLELDEGLQAIAQCWKHVKASHHERLRLYECSLSANAFGTEGRIHRDMSNAAEPERHRTALVYCNGEWDPNWAGETLVLDAQGEITAGVMPRPGRVMKIAGDPPHVGRSVSRICPTDRRVLIFKYWTVDH